MSDIIAAKLDSLDALVRSLHVEKPPNTLLDVLSPLIVDHADDLKEHLDQFLAAIDEAKHADENFESSVHLISTQVEGRYRSLAQDLASLLGNPNIGDLRDITQEEFEKQVAILQDTNSTLLSAVTRLQVSSDVRDIVHKEKMEEEVESLTKDAEIQALRIQVQQLQQSHISQEDNPSQIDTGGSPQDEQWQAQLQLKDSEIAAEKAKSKNVEEKYQILHHDYIEIQERLADVTGSIRAMLRIKPSSDEDLIEFENLYPLASPWTALKVDDKVHRFKRVFGMDNTNTDICMEVADLADSAMAGRTCTVLAYGATGTGKSYTFLSEDGLIPSYIRRLYQIAEKQSGQFEYKFEITAVEIYLNKLYDLQASEDGEKVELDLRDELTVKAPDSKESAMDLLNKVVNKREVQETRQNANSSRSHFICGIKISKSPVNNPAKVTKGEVRFLDLAGSERVGQNAKSSSSDDKQANLVQAQGKDINNSLLDLSQGIRDFARTKPNGFHPTHSLGKYIKATLTPGARILLVGTVSPLVRDKNETCNTLRWVTECTSKPALKPTQPTPAKQAGRVPPTPPSSGGQQQQQRTRGNSVRTNPSVRTPTRPFPTTPLGKTRR
ncbi:P-loop containing nucleoside triphosphate hydrolase protein [Astrocystis sublimbata]|nr:P-loop containing nucleoside triphosphate hydrolase protein [Astrocystis sublimbata]